MSDQNHHQKRFHGNAERLRSAQRVAMLEPARVVAFCLEGITVESVLDVGTGTGLFAEAFGAAGVAVTGVDVSAEMLKHAQQHFPDACYIEGTAETLPLTANSFDLVFLAHVLHEVDDPIAALREAARTTRARVVIAEWPFRQEESGPPLEHRLSESQIVELAAKAGLGLQAQVSLAHVDVYAFGAV